MKLFKKKQAQDSTTPSEVQDYYQAENRERKSIAWLLAFATFVVTLVFVLLLFFAGKWLYQHFQNNDKQSGDSSKTQEQGTQNSGQNQSSSDTNSSTNQQNGGTQGAQSAPPQTSSTSTTTPSPSTANADTQLPRTGPDEDL